MATILTKKSDTSSSVPLAADLTNAAGGAELAVNTADKRLYSKTSGGSVVELGTNPSALSLPNGTANGVPYLNGSKVLTSGSALTFDGTNLGLGTTNPSGASGTTFAINGGAGQTRLALKNNNSGDASSDGFQIALLSDGVNVVYQNRESGYQAWEGNGSEQMRLTSTGLGIGTSSPNYSLTSYKGGAVANYLQVASGATGAGSGNGLLLGVDASGNSVINAQGAVSLNTYVAGVLRTTIDSSGNLGLGVTPSAWGSSWRSLDVGGGGAFAGAFNSAYMLGNAYYSASGGVYKSAGAAGHYGIEAGTHVWKIAPSGTAGNAISFTQAMTLDASGNLLVGRTFTYLNERLGVTFNAGNTGYTSVVAATTSQAHMAFYNGAVVGSITTNGSATTYNTTSDHRLKTVIGSVSGAGSRIDALEPIEYEWKSDGSRTRGFLAHKFQEVYAGSVTGSKDAVDKEGKPVYQSMQAGSSEVIADLVAEIQSLRKRLAALESK